MQKNEQLRSPEIHVPHAEERESSSAPLSLAQAEKVRATRQEMLAEITSDISPSLVTALTEKISREWQTLASFIEKDARAVEAKSRSKKVLSAEFFVQKPLGPNNF